MPNPLLRCRVHAAPSLASDVRPGQRKGAQQPTNVILQKTQSILSRVKKTLARSHAAHRFAPLFHSQSPKHARWVTRGASSSSPSTRKVQRPATAHAAASRKKAAAVGSRASGDSLSDVASSSSTVTLSHAAAPSIESEVVDPSDVFDKSGDDAVGADALQSSSGQPSAPAHALESEEDEEGAGDASRQALSSASPKASPSNATSDVDRQLRAVAKLCDAEFRNELRSSVHGRSHAPMPKLAAVSAAVIKLREAAEQNAAKNSEASAPMAAVKLSDFEFGCFDLFGTVDGILWKIFSEIGFVERKAVALVSETEWRHAVMNLVIFADFSAIIIGTSVDSHNDAEAALAHPSLPKGLIGSRVSLVEEFASKENVNHIISCLTALRLPRQPKHCTDKGMSGSIDLLLVDAGGGMDYWILDKITEVQPRVIVVKIVAEMATQAIPLVRPYKLDYTSTLRADRGMPILTAAAWADKNGYRVVGCDSEGGHAFLLLDGVGDRVFPSIDPHSCAPKVCAAQRSSGSAPCHSHAFFMCQSRLIRSRRSCRLNGKHFHRRCICFFPARVFRIKKCGE